jgi:hypothetical protein
MPHQVKGVPEMAVVCSTKSTSATNSDLEEGVQLPGLVPGLPPPAHLLHVPPHPLVLLLPMIEESGGDVESHHRHHHHHHHDAHAHGLPILTTITITTITITITTSKRLLY